MKKILSFLYCMFVILLALIACSCGSVRQKDWETHTEQEILSSNSCRLESFSFAERGESVVFRVYDCVPGESYFYRIRYQSDWSAVTESVADSFGIVEFSLQVSRTAKPGTEPMVWVMDSAGKLVAEFTFRVVDDFSENPVGTEEDTLLPANESDSDSEKQLAEIVYQTEEWVDLGRKLYITGFSEAPKGQTAELRLFRGVPGVKYTCRVYYRSSWTEADGPGECIASETGEAVWTFLIRGSVGTYGTVELIGENPEDCYVFHFLIT